MSKVKATVEKKGDEPSWGQWLQSTSSLLISQGLEWGRWAYTVGRVFGWIIVTTGIVTILPLVFEIKRESTIEELERLQIGQAISSGQTPQDLANSGLTSAIEPKVLS